MQKIPRHAYTTEFKALAVKRVIDGTPITTVVKELGIGDQTLRNWLKASQEGKLKGANSRVVAPAEMELSRLRAENVRLKRENEITMALGHPEKAAASRGTSVGRTSRRMFCEVRLDG